MIKSLDDRLNTEQRILEAAKHIAIDSDIPAAHFMANFVSMCVFPFIAQPLFKEFFVNDEPEAFNHFIEERKRIIVETLMRGIAGPLPASANF